MNKPSEEKSTGILTSRLPVEFPLLALKKMNWDRKIGALEVLQWILEANPTFQDIERSVRVLDEALDSELEAMHRERDCDERDHEG